MGRRIVQEKDLSGDKKEFYVWDGSLVEPLPYFMYEVCAYKYWKNGFCILGSRLFKSDRLLNIKHPRKYERHDGYLIEKTVDLVGAPYGFIREMNLPVYERITKHKKSKRK